MWGKPEKAQEFFNQNVELMAKRDNKSKEEVQAQMHARNPIV